MNVSRVKEIVRENGGDVTDVGYVTVGRGKTAHIEAYYEDHDDVPSIPNSKTMQTQSSTTSGTRHTMV